MSQRNPDDPAQNLFAVSMPPEPSAKKYLGICRDWIAISDPDVRGIFDTTLAHLTSQMGYEAVDIKLPYLREGQLAHACSATTEAASHAQARVKDPARYLGPLNHPNRIAVSVGSQTPAADLFRYGQIRQVIMEHLAFLFDKYPGLLVLTPTTPMAGLPIHPGDQKYGFTDANVTIRAMSFVWYSNMSGCPAVSCPVGYVDPAQGEGKLPVGVMAMGEWGAEEQLLAFARDTETYLNHVYPGGRQRPAEWADAIAMAKENAAKKGDK
jgi:Asp-tRNA(Asn)/Glu-tRNA(Gln) amidotransferase A subunit family amidase